MRDSASFEARHSNPLQPNTDRIIGAGIDFTDPNSPLAPYYLRTIHLAAIAFFGVVFLLLNFAPLWHTDIWGHLSFGRWIVEHRQLPDGNPFAPLPSEPVPANHYSWLSQTLLYLIYTAGAMIAGGSSTHQLQGGIDALRGIHALLVVLRLGILFAAFYRLAGSYRLALAGVVVSVVLFGGNLAIFRPQVLGEFCFACLLYALSKPVLSWRGIAGVVLLMTLWANLHGSFAVGLLLLGVVFVGRIIERAIEVQSLNPGDLLEGQAVRPLLLTLSLAVASIAVFNPVGPWIYLQTIQMARHPVVLLMDEWQPLAFTWGQGGHWAYIATWLLILASVGVTRRWPSATSVLLILVFGLQPLWHQRALIWWLMLVPWIILPWWQPLVNEERFSWLRSHSTPSFQRTILAALTIIVLLLWSIPGQWLIAGEPTLLERSLSSGTPIQLAQVLTGNDTSTEPALPALKEWLAAQFPEGQYRGAVFTSELQGDFLVWALPEHMPVFVYSHVHLFTKEHFDKVLAVRRGTHEWNHVLDGYNVNLVLVEAELNPRLRAVLYEDPNWTVVLDETGLESKIDRRCRLLIAVRKHPR